MKKKLTSCPVDTKIRRKAVELSTANYDQAISYLIETYGGGALVDYTSLVKDISSMNNFFANGSSLSVVSLLVVDKGKLASYDADTIWAAKRDVSDWNNSWLTENNKGVVTVFHALQVERNFVEAYHYSQADLSTIIKKLDFALAALEKERAGIVSEEEVERLFEETISLTVAGKVSEDFTKGLASLLSKNNSTDPNGNRSYISSAIAVPLWHDNNCLGALLIGHRETRVFGASRKDIPHVKKVKSFVDFAEVLATIIAR